jgi:hypothetical protein
MTGEIGALARRDPIHHVPETTRHVYCGGAKSLSREASHSRDGVPEKHFFVAEQQRARSIYRYTPIDPWALCQAINRASRVSGVLWCGIGTRS